jgi:hypothetical protein
MIGQTAAVRKTTRRAMPTLAVVAVSVCLLLAACSGGGMEVRMDRNGSQVTVTVKDHTGLVRSATGGSSQVPDPLPAAPAAWNPNGELTQVSVYWQSTACSQHPTLDLSGNALLLTIDPGPSASGCSDSAPLPNIVTLTLGAVTDVHAITVRMAGSG